MPSCVIHHSRRKPKTNAQVLLEIVRASKNNDELLFEPQSSRVKTLTDSTCARRLHNIQSSHMLISEPEQLSHISSTGERNVALLIEKISNLSTMRRHRIQPNGDTESKCVASTLTANNEHNGSLKSYVYSGTDDIADESQINDNHRGNTHPPATCQLSVQLQHQETTVAGSGNWLEHEVQPTDSEIESTHRERTDTDLFEGCRSRRLASMSSSIDSCATDNCDTTVQNITQSQVSRIGSSIRLTMQRHRSTERSPITVTSSQLTSSNARSILDVSEPMDKHELLNAMTALRHIYEKKFGQLNLNVTADDQDNSPFSTDTEPSTLISSKLINRIETDIREIKSRLTRVCHDQQILRSIMSSRNAANEDGPYTGVMDTMVSCSGQNNNIMANLDNARAYRSVSMSSGPETPSPRDMAMFIPLENNNSSDREEELKMKRKDMLMIKQLQRRENMLQRRMQRANDRRSLEEEERLHEEWMERAKAEQKARRDLILQSHQIGKQIETTAMNDSRLDLSNAVGLNANGYRDSKLQDRNGKSPWTSLRSINDIQPSLRSSNTTMGKSIRSTLFDHTSSKSSSFMNPTRASQHRMNRAASMMAGLNNPLLNLDDTENNLLSTVITRRPLQSGGGSLHDLFHASTGNRTIEDVIGAGNQDAEVSRLMAHGRGKLGCMNNGEMTNSTTSLLNGTLAGRNSRSLTRSSAKTNRHFMINAITHVTLAGQANRKQRDAALQEMETSCARHFMILFRDHRMQYRALYTYMNESTSVEKIHGIGPMSVDESMVGKFYKYNSGNRSFVYIPAKRFSIQCDAFVIHDDYWHKRALSTNRR